MTDPNDTQQETDTCYECDGSGQCWSCDGKGVRDNGERCFQCFGNGRCAVCGGSGRLWRTASQAPKTEGSKRVLTRVGFFRELGYEDGDSMDAARGGRRADDTTNVVAYLRAGEIFVASPGLVRDLYDAKRVAGSRSVRTDGSHAWPDALAYYVEHYGLSLPPQFEAHMAEQRWIVPPTIDLAALVRPPTRGGSGTK